jgi:hypothetical protein
MEVTDIARARGNKTAGAVMNARIVSDAVSVLASPTWRPPTDHREAEKLVAD